MTVIRTDTVLGFDDSAAQDAAGDPVLLGLPGWCGARTVFDPLRQETMRRRRTVVADLPAQGASPTPPGDFDAAAVTDAVVELVQTRGIERFVPMTLAHAGWIGIELRRRLGSDRVPGLVLLDWMVLGPPPGFLDALTSLQDEQAWLPTRSALFDTWTAGVDEPSVHDYVRSMGEYGFAHWRRAGREIAAAFAAEQSPVVALGVLPDACPTLHLYAQPADPAVLDAQIAFAQTAPWFHVRRLDARSHFPMLEVPEAMAAAIEDFVCRL